MTGPKDSVLYKTSMRGLWIAIGLVVLAFLVLNSWWFRLPVLALALVFAWHSFRRYEVWRNQQDDSE